LFEFESGYAGLGFIMHGLFITGSDTGIGKTLVCGLLAGYCRRKGIRVITQKWVQTGCTEISEDLACHRALGGLTADEAPEALLNPYRFALPASPHLAAEQQGCVIDPAVIARAYHALAARFDLVLVEGAGGVLAPLTRGLLTVDLVAALDLPALVVVGNKLGCVNHALLTIEALRGRGIPLLGVIFNRLAEHAENPLILADNPRVVAEISGVPVLGEIPSLADPRDGAAAMAPIAEALLRRVSSFEFQVGDGAK
jgi:dethiobiotin synthetase